MASSLLALIDDIATLLDDVSVLSKVAAQKTAGVLGDDLALNAQQVTGVSAERELPVVWAVCKGSLLNKLILVPSALLISFVLPSAVTPLLMLGGAYLCYEGFEKLAHKFFASQAQDAAHAAHTQALRAARVDPSVDLLALEKDKVKGAIRTDFILSAEIIAITLGTVQDRDWVTQLAVLSGIAVVMTFGVYGIVGGIVKLDDAGLFLSRKVGAGAWRAGVRSLGWGLLRATPWLMKFLSVAGTAAMFLVGGGILVHGMPWLHHAVQAVALAATGSPGSGVAQALVPQLLNLLAGVVAGALVLLGVQAGQRLRHQLR